MRRLPMLRSLKVPFEIATADDNGFSLENYIRPNHVVTCVWKRAFQAIPRVGLPNLLVILSPTVQ